MASCDERCLPGWVGAAGRADRDLRGRARDLGAQREDRSPGGAPAADGRRRGGDRRRLPLGRAAPAPDRRRLPLAARPARGGRRAVAHADRGRRGLRGDRRHGRARARRRRGARRWARSSRGRPSPSSASCVALLAGELRQGAQEGVMLEAVARAAEVPRDAVRRARDAAAATSAPWRPRRSTAASRRCARSGCRSAARSSRCSPRRATTSTRRSRRPARRPSSTSSTARALQVHRRGDEVRAFTRSLDEITARVPEVVRGGARAARARPRPRRRGDRPAARRAAASRSRSPRAASERVAPTRRRR